MTSKINKYFLTILLGLLSGFIFLKGIDFFLERQAYKFMKFDDTLRLRNFPDNPFLLKQSVNYFLSDDKCSASKKVFVILGASEATGTYMPYKVSAVATLNKMLPKDYLVINLAVDGYLLSNQVPLQRWILKMLPKRCKPIFLWSIVKRNFEVERSVAEIHFYDNHLGKFEADFEDFRQYRKYFLGPHFTNLIGFIEFLKRPWRNKPDKNLFDFIKMWPSEDAEVRYSDNEFKDFKRTHLWRERIYSPGAEKLACPENTTAVTDIADERSKKLIRAQIKRFQDYGLKLFIYWPVHSTLWTRFCPDSVLRERFKKEYPEGFLLSHEGYTADDFADAWHPSDSGDYKLALNLLNLIKKIETL